MAADVLIGSVLRELTESFSKMEIKEVVGFTKDVLGGEFLKIPEDGVEKCFEELQNQGRISSKNTELLGYYADHASKNTRIKKKIDYLNRVEMKDKQNGSEFVGREEDVDAIIHYLTSRKTSLLNLCGDPGVGKTTLAERVAETMVSGKVVKIQRTINLRNMKDLRVVYSGILHAFNSPKVLKPSSEYVYEVIENLEVKTVVIFDNAEDLLTQRPSKENELSFCGLMKGMVERDKHSKLTMLLTSRVPLPDELRDYFINYYVKPLKQNSSAKVFNNINLSLSELKKREISMLCQNKPLNLKLLRGVLQEKLLNAEEVQEKLKMLNKASESGTVSERSDITAKKKSLDEYSDVNDKNVISEVFDKFTFELRKASIKLSMFQRSFGINDAQKMLNQSYSETAFYLSTLKNRGFLQERKNEQNHVTYEMHSLINEFLRNKSLEKNYQEIYTSAKQTFFNIFLAKAKHVCRLLDRDYMNAYSIIEMERLNLLFSLQISFEMEFLYFSSDFRDISIIVDLFSILIPGQEREELFRKWSETAHKKGEWTSYANLVNRQILVLLEKSTRRSEAQQLLKNVEDALNRVSDKSSDLCRLAESSYYFAKGAIAYSVCASREPNVWQNAAKEALELFEKSLQLREKLLGDHTDTARTLNVIGNCHMQLKNLDLALKYYSRALDMRRRLTGSDKHVDMPVYVNQIAAVHERKGKLYMKQALQITGDSSQRKELYEKYQQEFHQALQKYQEALDLEKKLHISGYANTATFYRNMSNIYSYLEDYKSSLMSAKKALFLRKKVLGIDADTIRSYYQVGIVYEKLDEPDKCLKYFYKAYVMELALPAGVRSAVKDNVLAKIESNLGSTEEAEMYDKRHKEAVQKGCLDDETMTSEDEQDDEANSPSTSSGTSSETFHDDTDLYYHSSCQSFTLDVEGGFHDLSGLGVLIQYPPNTVTHPTRGTYRKRSQDFHPGPAEDTESLVSYIVEIDPGSLELQESIIVSLMHSGPSKKDGYETVVKAFIDKKGGVWEQIEVLDGMSNELRYCDVRYLQVNINKPTTLAVVARLITDEFQVTERGCVVRSCVCNDVTVEFPEGAVDKTVNGTMKLLPMPDNIDIGITAYPCPAIAIGGFQDVDFKCPVKIRLPRPRPAGYHTGQVSLFCMEDMASHKWKDITGEITYFEDESYIELHVDHFCWSWTWIYKVPLTLVSSLFQYLFCDAPQEVCFAVFKEFELCSFETLTMTLVCLPNHENKEVTASMKDEGYTRLALSTADKKMRPNDKAFTKVEGCYKKINEEFFLQFLKDQVCRKELRLLKAEEDGEADGVEREADGGERGADGGEGEVGRDGDYGGVAKRRRSRRSEVIEDLILSFLANLEKEEHQLCRLFIDRRKISQIEKESPSVPISYEVTESTRPIPSSEICQELDVCFRSLDLQTIEAETAAAKVVDLLKLDRLSVKDPPRDVVEKCRCLCVYLKQKGREDIVLVLKEKLPDGMTGPRRDEKMLFKDIKLKERQLLTRALCGEDKWKMMASELGIPSEQLDYYNRQHDPVEAILREVDGLTVGKLYDVLDKSNAAALADKYL